MATQTQQDQIRRIFASKGGLLTIRDLVLSVRQAGVYSEEEIARRQFAWISADCRRALAAEDASGLPHAQPINAEPDDDEEERPAPLWQQLSLFTYEQAAELIQRRKGELTADYRKLLVLRDWCRERFGKAPRIPRIA